MAGPRKPWAQTTAIIIAVILIVVAFIVASPNGDHIAPQNDSTEDDSIPSKGASDFWRTELPADGGNVSTSELRPLEPISKALQIGEGSRQGEVRLNETIKGLTEFRNAQDYWTEGYDIGRFHGNSVDLSVPHDVPPGEVQPLDMLFTEEGIAYIINEHRGVMTFNVSSPSGPVAMGQVDVLGTPQGMAIKDGFAFVLTDTDLGYQMNCTGMGWDEKLGPPSYQIRAQLVIVDLRDPSSPEVVRTVGLDGFVTAGCLVNNKILLFGNRYHEFTQPFVNATADMGRVYVVDVSEPPRAHIIQLLDTERPIALAHVTSDTIFLVLRKDTDNPGDDNEIEIFSNDGASIELKKVSTLCVPGTLSDARWLDGHGSTFRVLSYISPIKQEFLVRSLDVSDLGDIKVLSELTLEGAMDHRLVSFDGDRLLLFHGRDYTYEESNLTVVNLGDPDHPTVEGSTILPGEYFWAQAFDGWVLAAGAYEVYGADSSIVCLIQLSDEGPVLSDSETFAPRWSSAAADGFMDATMLLKDEGLVLVPARWDNMSGEEKEREGVGAYAFAFDLERGSLTAGARVGVPWTMYGRPEAMAQSESIIVSLSSAYIQFIDIIEPDQVRLVNTVLLVPRVHDIRLVQDRMAWIVRDYPGLEMYLWVGKQRDLELDRPDVIFPLGMYLDKWYWRGDHLLTYDVHAESADGTFIGRFRSIDLSDPLHPRASEPLDIELEGKDRPSTSEWFHIEDQNPVLVGGGLLVFLSKEATGGLLRWIDIRDPARLQIIRTEPINLSNPKDMRAIGHIVYITDMKDISKEETIVGNNILKYSIFVIDASDPVNSTVSGPINIPGTVIGVSTDGRTLFTHAFWSFDNRLTATFNAIRVKNGKATISWAMDTSYEVAVSDNRLVEVGHTSHYWMLLSNGENVDIMSTTFNAYDLSGTNGPRLLGSLEIFGGHRIDGIVGNYVLCEQYAAYYGKGGIQVICINPDGPPEAVGFFPIPMASYLPISLQEGIILIPAEDNCGHVIEMTDT